MPRKNQNYINETMGLLASSKQAFIRALKTGFGFIPIVKADPSQAEINNFSLELRDKIKNLLKSSKLEFSTLKYSNVFWF